MAEQAKVEVKVEPKADAAKAEAPKPAATDIFVKDAKSVEAKPAAAPVAKVAATPVTDKPAPAKKTVAVKNVKKKTVAKPAPKPVTKAVAAKVAAPVASPIQQIKDKTMSINETIKKQADAAMSQGKAAVEQFQAKAKEAVEQGTKSMEEMSSFARGNVEAMVEAGRVAAKGIETMAQQVVEMAKRNAEATTTAVRSFAGAKNANELIQLQSDFAREQFDKFVADGSKLTEMFVKFAGEAFEPISNRFALAADRIAKAGAR
jgi:phasin family protein